MELRQLRYFVAVAEEGNISRAAQKIFLTQPALSRQIKALEEELGQCLLERQAHSIRLTAAGELLLEEARELLRRADAALERVRAGSNGPRLRVGYSPSLAGEIISAAVETFTQTHPRLRLELLDLSTQEMLSGLENRKLDVAVTVNPGGPTRGLLWSPLMTAGWQVAVSQSHPLSRRPRLTPADVAQERLLVFCRRDYPEYWELLGKWFREHGQRFQVAGEYDGITSLLAAVGSGLGIALITESAAAPSKRVKVRALASPPPPVCIAAGCRSEESGHKSLQVLIGELQAAARASK